MMYNILSIADIHWDAMESNSIYKELSLVQKFIEKFKDIHLVVICGDYFDKKISMDSSSALLSIRWLHEMIGLSEKYDFKIRMIQGTYSHDNNQLNVFEKLESDRFKVFRINTLEETLPELKVLYCPEEIISTEDYYSRYINNLLSVPDICFFHGSFDVMLKNYDAQEGEVDNPKAIIFNSNDFINYINGPTIGGHWHNSSVIKDHIYYIGSWSRWIFGEDETKRMILTTYDTDTHSYQINEVENILASEYQTQTFTSSMLEDIKDSIPNYIVEIQQYVQDDPYRRVRIIINIDCELTDVMIGCINLIQTAFSTSKKIKVITKNKMEKKQKEKKEEVLKNVTSKYDFILNKSLPPEETLQKYIEVNDDYLIPVDFIKKYI